MAKRIVVDSEYDGLSIDALNKIFGFSSFYTIFRKYTIQEALAKLEAYEKSKEINVGDIVKDGKKLFTCNKEI